MLYNGKPFIISNLKGKKKQRFAQLLTNYVVSKRLIIEAKKQNEAEERRRQRRAESVENRIHEIETELADIQDEMSLPENSSDPEWMHEKASKMAALEEEVTALYDEWMELQ